MQIINILLIKKIHFLIKKIIKSFFMKKIDQQNKNTIGCKYHTTSILHPHEELIYGSLYEVWQPL